MKAFVTLLNMKKLFRGEKKWACEIGGKTFQDSSSESEKFSNVFRGFFWHCLWVNPRAAFSLRVKSSNHWGEGWLATASKIENFLPSSPNMLEHWSNLALLVTSLHCFFEAGLMNSSYLVSDAQPHHHHCLSLISVFEANAATRGESIKRDFLKARTMEQWWHY